jgi:inner membrane protein
MAWWLWVLFGLALLALEITTPGGFFVLFFGVAALVVGALVGVGFGEPPWVQWLSFSVLSVGSLLLFRGRLLAWAKGHEGGADRVDSLVGQIAIPQEDLTAGAVGRAELRGTVWTVRNVDTGPLTNGQRCRVVGVDGLTLFIRAAD